MLHCSCEPIIMYRIYKIESLCITRFNHCFHSPLQCSQSMWGLVMPISQNCELHKLCFHVYIEVAIHYAIHYNVQSWQVSGRSVCTAGSIFRTTSCIWNVVLSIHWCVISWQLTVLKIEWIRPIIIKFLCLWCLYMRTCSNTICLMFTDLLIERCWAKDNSRNPSIKKFMVAILHNYGQVNVPQYLHSISYVIRHVRVLQPQS